MDEFGCPSARYKRSPWGELPDPNDGNRPAPADRGPDYSYNHMFGENGPQWGASSVFTTALAQVQIPAETIQISETGTVDGQNRFGTYLTPWWYDHYYFDFGPGEWWRPPIAHNSSSNDGGMNCAFADGHAKFMKFMSFITVAGGTYNVKYYYWLLDKTGYTP